jgi:hypothetical protein
VRAELLLALLTLTRAAAPADAAAAAAAAVHVLQARLMHAGLLARRARAELLLSQMGEAAKATEVDFVNPVIK